MRPARQHARGFTLVEMMVVVAIIGILSAVMIGLNARPYGANARNTSDEIVAVYNMCKMRAVSTRRWHRCELTNTGLMVYQWSVVGMAVPVAGPGLSWQFVQTLSLPTGVVIWNASATVDIAGGLTPGQNTSVLFDMDFRPDGSSTGGTVFVTDTAQNKKYRVLVYKSTGASYERQNW